MWIKRTLRELFPEAVFIETTVQDLRRYSFIICGGGGLFIFYVEPPWNKLPIPVPYGALGLGAEFPHPDDTAKRLSEGARFFYIRDRYSLECMRIPDNEPSFDLTFARPLPWIPDGELDTDKVMFVWRDGAEWLNDPQFNAYLHFADNYDVWRDVITRRFKSVNEDDFQTRDDDIESRVKGAGFVISGRYHGIVAAIQKGLPFVAIDICPKIRALCAESGLERYCVKLDEVDRLDDLITDAVSNVKDIRAKEKDFRTEAHETMLRQVDNARTEIAKASGFLSRLRL